MSCTDQSQKPEPGADKKPPDEASKTIPVLIDGTTSSSECPYAMNTNLDSNKTVKSWATNYLQSIGLTYDKTIFKRKVKMNSSQDVSSNFLTQDSTVTSMTDANLENVIKTANYKNFCNPSHANLGNDVCFANYGNVAPTGNQGSMPAMTYTNHLYVNDNNSYYVNQAKGNVANNQFPIIYYDPGTVACNTIVDTNLPNTSINTFDHSMTDVTNNIYYNSNETSQVVEFNLPIAYSDTYCNQNNNYYCQPNSLNESNMIISATVYDNNNKTQITTVDSNLQSLNAGSYDNLIHANSSTAFHLSNVGDSQNIERETTQSRPLNAKENKFCDCLCTNLSTKLNQDKNQINENEKKGTKELKQACMSKVQENERRFRDFLQKLNMKRPSEQEKKEEKTEKSNEDKSNDIKRKETDFQQPNKIYPKLIKKKYVDEQEPIRHKKRKEIEVQPAKKIHNKFKERQHVDEREHTVHKKSTVIEFPQYKMCPLKKTKVEDELQPEANRKRKKVEFQFQQDEKTRRKFIKTKYVDEQEPVYKPPKMPKLNNEYENKKYDNSEYKAIKKANINGKPKTEIRISKSEKELPSRQNRKDSSSHKMMKSKIEATKYETSKISPDKSTTKISKTREFNKSVRHDKPENKDLRDILCQKLHKKENILKNKGREREIPKNDNLFITVNNDISKKEKSPEKSSSKTKSKRESLKKINLVINILYETPSSRSESDKSDCDDQSQQANSDLSFLDEINVDEIVESLSKSEKNCIKKNSISDETNTLPEEGVTINETISKDLIKKENSDINRTKVMIDNEELLNNLFLKEASLLDSLRLVHQEIETEKRCMEKYSLKEENQCLESSEPGVSMFVQKPEDKTQSLVPISVERIKKLGTNDIDMPCKEYLSNENHSHSDNDIEDIVNEKQIKKQSGIPTIIENNIPKQTVILGGDLNVIIDLSSDNSNDCNYMDTLKEKSNNIITHIDTIDLTTDDNTNNNSILNYPSKEIHTKIMSENESNNPINKTYTTAKIHEFQMKETNKISGNNSSKINNDTVVDITNFATNTIKGNLQDLERHINKDISNIQTISIEIGTSKPLATDITSATSAIDITQVKEENFSIPTFENVAKSYSEKVENHNSNEIKELGITETSKTLDIACNTTFVMEKKVGVKCNNVENTDVDDIICSPDPSISKLNVKEENYQTSLINIINIVNAKEVSEKQNVSLLSQKCAKLDETLSTDTNNVKVSETSIEAQINDNIVEDSDANRVIQKDEKGEKLIHDTRNEVNGNEVESSIEVKEKTRNEIKTKSNSPNIKVISSPSSKSTDSPSAASKKDKTNEKTVTSNVKIGEDNKKLNTAMTAIAKRLERQMLGCFNEKFTVVGLIHSGNFSKVFHCRSDKDGDDYAVKSLNSTISVYKNTAQTDMLFGLQNSITRNGCSSIVYLLNSFSLHGHLCLCMEYYPKNLERALAGNAKPFHINVVQHLARQLISAVITLVDNDILHLDINPSHILLNHTNSQLKLCGFDEARKVRNAKLHSNLGTLNYRPPESIVGYKQLGFPVDVWATGLVLYEMATNVQLFPGTRDNDILFKQMSTLGAIPAEMIHRSRFGHKHFTGSSFKRIMGSPNDINIITKFYKTGRLDITISRAYNKYWRPKAAKLGLVAADVDKTMLFTSLLKEMLQVDPAARMPIHCVDTHPFISRY